MECHEVQSFHRIYWFVKKIKHLISFSIELRRQFHTRICINHMMHKHAFSSIFIRYKFDFNGAKNTTWALTSGKIVKRSLREFTASICLVLTHTISSRWPIALTRGEWLAPLYHILLARVRMGNFFKLSSSRRKKTSDSNQVEENCNPFAFSMRRRTKSNSKYNDFSRREKLSIVDLRAKSKRKCCNWKKISFNVAQINKLFLIVIQLQLSCMTSEITQSFEQILICTAVGIAANMSLHL